MSGYSSLIRKSAFASLLMAREWIDVTETCKLGNKSGNMQLVGGWIKTAWAIFQSLEDDDKAELSCAAIKDHAHHQLLMLLRPLKPLFFCHQHRPAQPISQQWMWRLEAGPDAHAQWTMIRDNPQWFRMRTWCNYILIVWRSFWMYHYYFGPNTLGCSCLFQRFSHVSCPQCCLYRCEH